MSQCQECRKEKRSWQECPAVPKWFSPPAIFYCPWQIEWLCYNMETLEEGRWPIEPVDSGYYESGGDYHVAPRAYFEIPVGIAADVNLRLDKCGDDGLLVRQVRIERWDEIKLARLMHIPIDVMDQRIKQVIWYCSGVRSRRLTYDEYKRRRNISAAYRRER